jgi:hypothetical protein
VLKYTLIFFNRERKREKDRSKKRKRMSGAGTQHTIGRQAELQARGIGMNTIITPDIGGILLEEDVVRHIANTISGITNRKMRAGEIDTLIAFVREMPPQQFFQKKLGVTVKTIAQMFVRRSQAMAQARPQDTGTVEGLSGTDRHTDRASIADYQIRELMQTTASENPYKITAHADRRGDAVIDRDRADGYRSSPNNVMGSGGPQNIGVGAGIPPPFFQNVSMTLEYIRRFIDPANLDELFKRAHTSLSTGLQTYHGITFPHRDISFDSRNRDISDSKPNVIKWYINSSGQLGSRGDIHLQDTLQQIIRMRIAPFWLPVSNPINDFYSTVDMYIHELFQRVDVVEFLDSDQSIATQYGYHFRFRITRRGKDRIYLEPEEADYTFSKPVAQLDSVTVSFRNPFAQVTLPADSGVYTVTYGNPTLFTLTSGTNNQLNTGDLIYVLNFNSPSQSINDEFNTTDGLIITRISNTQFTVSIDTSSLAPGTLTGINVFYGSKRVFFQIEFTSLEH